MLHLTNVVKTFPSVQIQNDPDALPIEVSLIAQLGHGAGNHLYAQIASRQKRHPEFIDELEEPSVKLGGVNFPLGDTTSLYSFIVGPKGHPFHKHSGHRIFTAVSGSGGAQLRFSTSTKSQLDQDPADFIRKLRFINIPADCLFTVRFGGEVWHQFFPLSKNSLHPVFFALSCHTDELGGNLSEDMKAKIILNEANIPALTELRPPEVSKLMQLNNSWERNAHTTTLSLDAPAGTWHRKVCDAFRSGMGILRGSLGSFFSVNGYIAETDFTKTVIELSSIPENSLLRKHLTNKALHHEDTFLLSISDLNMQDLKAKQLLAILLEGFLVNSPKNVSRLMMLRNIIVKPLKLRTSPLACPVSSLLSTDTTNLFAEQYPVLDQYVNEENSHAQVILGANDKHLEFRSCVGVEILDAYNIKITLGNRVHCKNFFGKFYMSVIDYVHRHYIVPMTLRRAADYLIFQITDESIEKKYSPST